MRAWLAFFAAFVVFATMGLACSATELGLFDDVQSTNTKDAGPLLDGSSSTSGADASEAGTSGQTCSTGGCACPLYHALCKGTCIPTSSDPTNCGACDVKCAGAQVCAAGACVAACVPGLVACDHRCVDLQNDSDYCGDCATRCGSGEGCVAGVCVDAVALGAPPASCASGGPPIVIDAGRARCLGELAQTTFRWALCSCANLDLGAPLVTDAFDSTKAPYVPGEIGGSVGVDRDVPRWSQGASIGGSLWIGGAMQYRSTGPSSTEIKEELHLAGSWNADGPFTVDKDAFVTGTLTGVTVKGALHSVPVAPGCDCTAENVVPVDAIIKAHRAPNNDNAAIALDPRLLEMAPTPIRLDLPCGNFYFTKIATSNAVTIAAHGRTAIYIDGPMSPTASLAFVLDASAELDLFVAESPRPSPMPQAIVLGSPNTPALTRAYFGGPANLPLAGDVRIAAQVYTGGPIDWSAANEMYGSLRAGNFTASQAATIHFDRAILRAGSSCPASSP